jgi:large subunit ribosomal protein L22
MKAFLKNYRQAPRKVRLVADMVRGKNVAQAMTELNFTSRKAAPALVKLLKSAVANAKDLGGDLAEDALFIKKITVDNGVTFTRYRPRARGRAAPINKETSRIVLELDEIPQK